MDYIFQVPATKNSDFLNKTIKPYQTEIYFTFALFSYDVGWC